MPAPYQIPLINSERNGAAIRRLTAESAHQVSTPTRRGLPLRQALWPTYAPLCIGLSQVQKYSANCQMISVLVLPSHAHSLSAPHLPI